MVVRTSDKCNTAFCELKELLLSYPVLRNVNFSLAFTLQVDASDVGVGAVLSQPDEEGMEHPVAYFSRKLLPREQKFSVIEKEYLAIKLGRDICCLFDRKRVQHSNRPLCTAVALQISESKQSIDTMEHCFAPIQVQSNSPRRIRECQRGCPLPDPGFGQR